MGLTLARLIKSTAAGKMLAEASHSRRFIMLTNDVRTYYVPFNR